MNLVDLPNDVLDIINKKIKDDYIKQRIAETPLRHALKKKLREEKEAKKWELYEIQKEIEDKKNKIEREKIRKRNGEQMEYCRTLQKLIEKSYFTNLIETVFVIGGDKAYIETYFLLDGEKVCIKIY